MSTLLIRLDRWDHVRERFTEAEVSRLATATVGHTLCPRGAIVELNELPAALADKLRDELGKAAR